MPLIVEDGSGVANSNSYITVDFADEYHADRGSAEWAAANNNSKEQALIKGTDYLDSHYIFKGAKISATQSLKFPRDLFRDERIPIPIQKAAAIYSLFALKGALYDSEKVDIEGTVKKTRTKQKVGSIETEVENEFQSGGTVREIHENQFDSIQFLIYPYIVEKQTVESTISGGSNVVKNAPINGELSNTRA